MGGFKVDSRPGRLLRRSIITTVILDSLLSGCGSSGQTLQQPYNEVLFTASPSSSSMIIENIDDVKEPFTSLNLSPEQPINIWRLDPNGGNLVYAGQREAATILPQLIASNSKQIIQIDPRFSDIPYFMQGRFGENPARLLTWSLSNGDFIIDPRIVANEATSQRIPTLLDTGVIGYLRTHPDAINKLPSITDRLGRTWIIVHEYRIIGDPTISKHMRSGYVMVPQDQLLNQEIPYGNLDIIVPLTNQMPYIAAQDPNAHSLLRHEICAESQGLQPVPHDQIPSLIQTFFKNPQDKVRIQTPRGELQVEILPGTVATLVENNGGTNLSGSFLYTFITEDGTSINISANDRYFIVTGREGNLLLSASSPIENQLKLTGLQPTSAARLILPLRNSSSSSVFLLTPESQWRLLDQPQLEKIFSSIPIEKYSTRSLSTNPANWNEEILSIIQNQQNNELSFLALQERPQTYAIPVIANTFIFAEPAIEAVVDNIFTNRCYSSENNTKDCFALSVYEYIGKIQEQTNQALIPEYKLLQEGQLVNVLRNLFMTPARYNCQEANQCHDNVTHWLEVVDDEGNKKAINITRFYTTWSNQGYIVNFLESPYDHQYQAFYVSDGSLNEYFSNPEKRQNQMVDKINRERKFNTTQSFQVMREDPDNLGNGLYVTIYANDNPDLSATLKITQDSNNNLILTVAYFTIPNSLLAQK